MSCPYLVRAKIRAPYIAACPVLRHFRARAPTHARVGFQYLKQQKECSRSTVLLSIQIAWCLLYPLCIPLTTLHTDRCRNGKRCGTSIKLDILRLLSVLLARQQGRKNPHPHLLHIGETARTPIQPVPGGHTAHTDTHAACEPTPPPLRKKTCCKPRGSAH